MKLSFKTLSFIFFISLMLQVCPLYSRAEEEASAQTKDIQVIDNPYEFGKFYVRNRADEYKKIKVSIEDIRNSGFSIFTTCYQELQGTLPLSSSPGEFQS